MIEIEIIRELDLIKYRDAENIYISSWVDFKIDLSIFSSLRYARLTNKKRINIGSCKNLEHLVLLHINKDRDNISELHELFNLNISQGNILDLKFLKGMNKLKILTLNYLNKLSDVSDIIMVKETLEELEINSCKNIVWKNELSQMKNLKKLILDGFKFENIDWVKDLSNLKHLSLVGSNVLNGDISPAKDIEYVSIDNKRHYNYRFDNTSRKIVSKL